MCFPLFFYAFHTSYSEHGGDSGGSGSGESAWSVRASMGVVSKEVSSPMSIRGRGFKEDVGLKVNEES
jgi:hypothetical protein